MFQFQTLEEKYQGGEIHKVTFKNAINGTYVLNTWVEEERNVIQMINMSYTRPQYG